MEIHVLASIGNVQVCSHPPEPSNPPEINDNQRTSMQIHVLASIGNVQASPHPPDFSKPFGNVPNAMCHGNRSTKKKVGGRGGAHKLYGRVYLALPGHFAKGKE